ncbi:MAG: LamG domain-containing protein [Bacteroidetes bacterium]|nr:LamG domain-containing protein [Bacteroidota bacterium]
MKTKIISKAFAGIFIISYFVYPFAFCFAQSPLITGLSVYYKFDGNGNDATGGGNTITNVGSVAYASGKINNGADFGSPNSTKYFTGIAGSAFEPTGNFTITCWVKPALLNSAHHWIFTAYDESSSAKGIYFFIGPGNDLRVGIATTGNNTNVGDLTSLFTGTWYFVACRFTSGGTLSISVNNNTPNTITPNFVQSYGSPNIRFGNRKTSIEELFFSGMIDELGLWTRVLSDAEVTNLYNSGNGFAYPFTSIATLSTQAVSSIGGTTATGNGTVTLDGGATITERGICWNTSSTPTTANSKATSAGTTGTFTSSMTGLAIGTLYYVRAYAINSVGISYGNEVTFTTLNIPTVTTQAVTSIAATTATGNGNVTSDGGATITERGVCWNTSTTPTTANSKATSTGTTGAFTASITGLTAGTSYYVRAYTINSVGISYGNQVTFSSPATATVNWNISNVQEITLTANRSFTFTNGKSGGIYHLIVKQDVTGGWAVSWPANVKWSDTGIAPILTSTSNAVAIIKFLYDGAYYYETEIKQF